jgi:lysozyme family protein
MTGVFDQAFEVVVGHEGGFDATQADPGNWTSGVVGVGRLAGTKYGVSAAAYPDVAIADLTLDGARAIFRRDYWDPVRGDDLPPSLALLVFDCAVNNGVSTAARWLQSAVGSDTDGAIGPLTLRAVAAATQSGGVAPLCAHFHAKRIFFMACLPSWRVFGRGWSERLSLLPYQSLTMGS